MMAVLQKGSIFKVIDGCTDYCIAFIEKDSMDYYERSGEHKGMPLFVYRDPITYWELLNE